MILKIDKNSYFLKYIDGNINDVYINSFKNDGILLKILKKIKLDFILYNNWKKNIKNTDCIIIFDNAYSDCLVNYIKKKNSKCKVYFYFWNHIAGDYIKFLNNICDETWTFDDGDAKKYSLKFNPQFYTKNIIPHGLVSNDIVFLGRNKKRNVIISTIKEKCDYYNIKNNFVLVDKEKKVVDYDYYLNMIFSSKCILDVCQEGQTGLSLRPLEALFFEKKLITNNKNIVNYSFYDKNNVFIIGYDDFSDLYKFINSDYNKKDLNIISYYDYEFWLKRFGD